MLQNVLITSAAKKIPLIKDVRNALQRFSPGSKIYTADSDSNALASHFSDYFWQMPSLQDLSIEDILKYCLSHSIKFIIPTRDGEFPFFAQYQSFLRDQGIFVFTSDLEAIKNCQDKYLFSEILLAKNLPAIPTFLKLENIINQKKIVIKERTGSGSQNIALNLNREEALKASKNFKNPIFQAFVSGREFSADVFLTKQKRVKGIVLRTRDLIINGESQVTTSFSNSRIESIIAKTAEILGLQGHCVFQAFITSENDDILIIEVNPRFGGASSLSVACGLDSFFWFFQESSGQNLKHFPFLKNEEKRLIRTPSDTILTL